MGAAYVDLHAKSFYSFSLGASHPHELLMQAKAHGCRALALTDTNLCGALEFARLAGSLDIQPITGGELILQDGSRLTLLARTRQGYADLSRLFTRAGAVDRRAPRVWSCCAAGEAGVFPTWCRTAAARRPPACYATI